MKSLLIQLRDEKAEKKERSIGWRTYSTVLRLNEDHPVDGRQDDELVEMDEHCRLVPIRTGDHPHRVVHR